MKYQSFIYPEVKREDYRFGSIVSLGVTLKEDGDWRTCTPPGELQKKEGIESSACYVDAQQHTIATIKEALHGIKDSNYSARFNALLSNGSEIGGDPLKGAESIRKYDGLIPDEMMPFSDDIESWADFHSWQGVNEEMCRKEGQNYLTKWKLNYGIVFEKNEPLETKYAKLRESLKKSPVPLSVYGSVDADGNYLPKPNWVRDTHLVEAVYLDEDNVIWVWDTYEPFLKKLPPLYNPDFAMMWTVTKIEDEKWGKVYKELHNKAQLTDMGSTLIHWLKSIWDSIIKLLKNL